jgi:hypothetical protein
MVGISIEALAPDQLVDAKTAMEIAKELMRESLTLDRTYESAVADADKIDWEESGEVNTEQADEDRRDFIHKALIERLGLTDG